MRQWLNRGETRKRRELVHVVMERCINVARYDADATRHYAAMFARRERACIVAYFARPKRSWYREAFQLNVNPILEVWSANRLNCWLWVA